MAEKPPKNEGTKKIYKQATSMDANTVRVLQGREQAELENIYKDEAELEKIHEEKDLESQEVLDDLEEKADAVRASMVGATPQEMVDFEERRQELRDVHVTHLQNKRIDAVEKGISKDSADEIYTRHTDAMKNDLAAREAARGSALPDEERERIIAKHKAARKEERDETKINESTKRVQKELIRENMTNEASAVSGHENFDTHEFLANKHLRRANFVVEGEEMTPEQEFIATHATGGSPEILNQRMKQVNETAARIYKKDKEGNVKNQHIHIVEQLGADLQKEIHTNIDEVFKKHDPKARFDKDNLTFNAMANDLRLKEDADRAIINSQETGVIDKSKNVLQKEQELHGTTAQDQVSRTLKRAAAREIELKNKIERGELLHKTKTSDVAGIGEKYGLAPFRAIDRGISRFALWNEGADVRNAFKIQQIESNEEMPDVEKKLRMAGHHMARGARHVVTGYGPFILFAGALKLVSLGIRKVRESAYKWSGFNFHKWFEKNGWGNKKAGGEKKDKKKK